MWGRVWRCGAAAGGPRRSGLQGCLLGIGSKEKYNNHAPPSLFVLHLSRGFRHPLCALSLQCVCACMVALKHRHCTAHDQIAPRDTHIAPQLNPTHLYAYIRHALEHTHGDATQDEPIYVLIYTGVGVERRKRWVSVGGGVGWWMDPHTIPQYQEHYLHLNSNLFYSQLTVAPKKK